MTNVLVLHGPNLNLLDDSGRTLEVLDAELAARATKFSSKVKCQQSNSEGGLLDALHEHRDWAEAVIVNPGALAPQAFALAEALELLELRAIEVLVTPLPKSRGPSALADVVEAQLTGTDGYLTALTTLSGSASATEEEDDDAPLAPVKLLRPAPATKPAQAVSNKTLGRSKKPARPDATQEKTEKTLGRKSKPAATSDASKTAKGESSTALSRATVRGKLALRLSGALTPEAFATWARTQWQAVQANAPVEPGQRELLDEVLLMLAASTRASDHVLLTYMTKLDS